MKIDNKNVLVTGAGGFIASHLIEKLLDHNCSITALTHYNSFNSWGWLESFSKKILEKIKIIPGDVKDPNCVFNAMKGSEIVFHLAALPGIPFSYNSPNIYIETNVNGTMNILRMANQLGVEKIIHTSTSEIYGTAQFVPITEEHPINPQSPYAASKAAADFLALSFFRSFNTPVIIVRPFNTYGPRQSARAIVPTIITQILSGKKKILLGSLTPTRDLNFVSDTANGFIKAAEAENCLGEIINLGSNREISVGDLAEKISQLTRQNIEILQKEERVRPVKSEVNRLLASNLKAKRLLKWNPEFSLEEGLKKTIDWYSQNENLRFFKPDVYNI